MQNISFTARPFNAAPIPGAAPSPTGAPSGLHGLSSHHRRFLEAMSTQGAIGKPDGPDIVVTANQKGITMQRGRFERAGLATLVSRGAVAWRGTAQGPQLQMTDEGAALLQGKEELPSAPSKPVDVAPALKVNLRESPLDWLRRRQDGLIDEASFQAGERLRVDFERSGIAPRTGINWTQPVQSSGYAGLNATEAMVAARQRLNNAMTAMGPDVGGLVMDVCCFLKGLETVEQERGWPQRSAKVVLSVGLSSLAKHYGLSSSAVGAPNKAGIRSWTAPDATN
jgi:hypothetical protein